MRRSDSKRQKQIPPVVRHAMVANLGSAANSESNKEIIAAQQNGWQQGSANAATE